RFPGSLRCGRHPRKHQSVSCSFKHFPARLGRRDAAMGDAPCGDPSGPGGTCRHTAGRGAAYKIQSMSDKPLTDITFSSFELHPALLAGLESAGFTRCTPIQALTLPITLAGRDVAGQAQTGTGKTLAFLVTVINRLLSRPALAERK